MECEAHWIGWQLSRIAEKIGEPTSWEIAGVIVAGLAAIGTIGVAVANVCLIRRQHELQKTELEMTQRVRRRLFGLALMNRSNEVVSQALGMGNPDFSYEENTRELDRLAAETDEASAAQLKAYVLQRLKLRKSKAENQTWVFDLSFELGRQIDSWVDDPNSFQHTWRDAFDQENAWDEKTAVKGGSN